MFNRYPIISSETGCKYEVEIYPYCGKESNYTEGCLVRLYKKRWIFNHELKHLWMDNEDNKITLSNVYGDKTKTEYNYNMINMTKLIVNLYENTIKRKTNSLRQIDKDLEEFKLWDGIV
jgi:ribosomal protein L28